MFNCRSNNGGELSGNDFITNVPFRDPDYNGEKLLYNDYLKVWQKHKRNGDRKMVSDFVVTVIAIVNPAGVGQCETLVVCLQGVEKPLIFVEGKITRSSVIQQTTFCKRGAGVSDKDYYGSFVRAMTMCPNVFFLSIPKYSGGNLLHGGIYDYTSKASIIPGLEMLYPKEIQQHQLMQHDRKFEEVTADYRENLPAFLQAKLAVTIRVMSILLPFFESEGLKPDRFFVCSVSDEKGKTAMSVLLSRFDYNAPVVTSISGRITKVREMLSIGNDMTAIFTYSACENNMRAFQNALSELRRFISNETGFDAVTRKVIVLVTDVPGGIPEEYPVYYLSFAEDVVGVDIQKLQCLSGEFDYSLIQFLTNNPDAAKTLIRQSLDEAKELITHVEGTEHTDTMTMIIAVSGILEKIGIFSESDQQAFLNWFRTEADSRMTITEDICQRFQTAVSDSILKQDLRVAKQFGPPYYADDGHTAFIADTDGSINFSDDVLRRVILPRIPIVKNIAQLNKHLIEKGWLISTHTNKRQLKVTFESRSKSMCSRIIERS